MNAVRNYQKELEYLRKYFRITVFYYNPNITEEEEYRKRAAEQKKLIAAYNEKALCVRGEDGSQHGYYIDVMEGDYEPQRFFEIARGLERCPEGKERCFACYALRLRETAQRAGAGGYDYFTTTLTISPLKEYGLYRQDYCGCIYSRSQRQQESVR